MVKDTMQRKRPSFNESAFGYRSFSALLDGRREAAAHNAAPGEEGRRHLRDRGLRRIGTEGASSATAFEW